MFEEKNENGVDEENKNGAVVEMFEEIPSDPESCIDSDSDVEILISNKKKRMHVISISDDEPENIVNATSTQKKTKKAEKNIKWSKHGNLPSPRLFTSKFFQIQFIKNLSNLSPYYMCRQFITDD